LIREFKVDLNCLLYDATNFYTYINTRTKSELAQRGHNKQKRHDLRQVSLGMMTTADFHIPLLHLVYGGNVGDAVEFGSVIDELVRRYKHLTEACPHITLVFDKGNNSEANIEALPSTGLHFVGSLKLNQCQDLLNVPLRKYQTANEEELEGLKTYRVRKTVFGQERTVLVTHNENLLAGQLQGLGHNLGKCKSELQELQTRLNRWITGQTKQGKKPTLESVNKNIETILRREYMTKVIKTTVVDRAGSLQLNYQVDQNVIGRLTRTVLGKTILFTDNHEWTDDQIVRAYRSQYHLEHAFREMKNPHVLGWNPRGHWTDQKIRVHAFYCVMALTLVSLLRRELATEGVTLSAEKLMENLNAIRETISIYPQEKKQPPKLSFSISQMNSIQQKLYDLLNLSRFRTN
jgi:transposase